jgi:predicted DNA-binding protein YlxM (UPF0122 family)
MEQSVSDKTLGRAVRMAQLLDLYGSLLTEKQRLFIELHYLEDLSFGEIGHEHNVSRQAVHDAVKHAESTLEEYEVNLHLLSEGGQEGAEGVLAESEAPEEPRDEKVDAVLERLGALKKNIQRQGIIYNSGWIVAEIDKILEALR